MLYILGKCERCKESFELKLNDIAVDKNADITMKLILYHRPKPIGSACACGGRVRAIYVSEVHDDGVRTLLPLELWQMLYEEGMSLHGIADVFNTSPSRVRYSLVGRGKHKISVVNMRPVGRPRKTKRTEVQSEEQSIIKTVGYTTRCKRVVSITS